MTFEWKSPLSIAPVPHSTMAPYIALIPPPVPPPPERWRPWVRLASPLTGRSEAGEFDVPAGFVYDQASVPRLFRWLVSPSGPHIRRAACLHDWRCPWPGHAPDPSQGETLTSDQAADEFYDGMIADGASRWRASLCWWAVRNYGPKF